MTENGQGPGIARGFAFSGPPEGRLYLRPLGLAPVPSAAVTAGFQALAGGPLAYAAVEMLARGNGAVARARATLPELAAWAAENRAAAFVDDWLARLGEARPPCAGLTLDRPRLMGIVNVTPDSFSDGGAFAGPADAIAHGLAMVEAGADMLDIGGESTRPGAAPVGAEEQLSRVLPVIEGLRRAGVPLSADTRSAAVMRAAVAAGAAVINDVSALAHDPDSLGTAARLGVPVVLTHMRGEPATMAQHAAYADVALDVYDELAARVRACLDAGIPRGRILVDPGFGFAKTTAQNAALLARLALLHGLGCALVAGASRKTFARGQGRERPQSRLAGSLAAALAAAAQGAQILRVHDVAETREALAVWQRTAGATDDA